MRQLINQTSRVVRTCFPHLLILSGTGWRLGAAAAAGFALLVSSAPSSHRNISKGTPSCPVTAARLAEVARLREAVVVEVTELGVGGLAPWTL